MRFLPHLVVALCLCLPHQLAAQCQYQEIFASDFADSDGFATSVQVRGLLAIVGAQDDDDQGTSSGSAYVFRFQPPLWVEEAKLKPAGGAASDLFGAAVAIDGDIAVVGAPQDDDSGTDAGAVYVFQRSGGVWTQVARLSPPVTSGSPKLGASVAIQGDVIVAGAPLDDALGTNAGMVYVYQKPAAGWTNSSDAVKLTGSDLNGGESFGTAVAIEGSEIIAGAPFESNGGLNDGAAYVFVKGGGTWTPMGHTAKLTATDSGTQLGGAVALSGARAIAGARVYMSGTSSLGAAYVFDRPGTGWVDRNETQRLTASNGQDGDFYGQSVAIEGSVALVGSMRADHLGVVDAGKVYLYTHNGSTWGNEQELVATDYDRDQLGNAVSMDGINVFAGAWRKDHPGGSGKNAGAALYFVTDEPSATFSTYGSGPLSLGGAVVGPCDCDLAFDATGATPNSGGFLFVGLAATSGIHVGPPGFILWVAPPFWTFTLPRFDGAGKVHLSFRLPPDMGQFAGLSLYLQAAATDPVLQLIHSNGLKMTLAP